MYSQYDWHEFKRAIWGISLNLPLWWQDPFQTYSRLDTSFHGVQAQFEVIPFIPSAVYLHNIIILPSILSSPWTAHRIWMAQGKHIELCVIWASYINSCWHLSSTYCTSLKFKGDSYWNYFRFFLIVHRSVVKIGKMKKQDVTWHLCCEQWKKSDFFV